jgi:hypothetical protein
MNRNEAYELGKRSESILDNPFWKNYPKEPCSEEAVLGRAFVDGWLEKNNEGVIR